MINNDKTNFDGDKIILVVKNYYINLPMPSMILDIILNL